MRTRQRLLIPAILITLVLAACSSEMGGQAGPVVVGPTTSSADGTTAGGTDDLPRGSGPLEGPIPRPTPGGTGAGVVPAGLAEFYDQLLDWQSCIPFNDNADLDEYFAAPGLDCANLIVPLDYQDPSGPTVTTAVIRSKATGSTRIGTLQVNPGGPGVSGIVNVAAMSTQPSAADLRKSFDLIGFDTRGLGASRPAVSCQTNAEKDAARAANDRTTTAAGIAAITEATTAYVSDCVARTGKDAGIDGPAFLVTLGTDTTVKDMDVLRSVLGDEKLNYLGYSYGTLLGSTYADQFGGNIRSMVLDGAVDPEADTSQELIGQAAGFQGSFEAFATWCATQSSCPVGTDPTQATAAFQKLTRPLLDAPLTLQDGRTMTYNDAITGTVRALYSDAYWTTLRTALENLANGDGYLLMIVADDYDGRNSDGEYSADLDVLTAVTCMDSSRRDPASGDVSVLQRVAAAAPFWTSGDPIVVTPDACSLWPGERTLQTGVPPAAGLPEVVVISTTGDPATPYAAGQALATELGADLITVTGDRHTAYLSAGITCVDTAATDYLTDLDMPEAGLTCP